MYNFTSYCRTVEFPMQQLEVKLFLKGCSTDEILVVESSLSDKVLNKILP